MDGGSTLGFEAFAAALRLRLQRAFVAAYGPERGEEATAEALAYAWEHFDRVQTLDNAAGYLFRVGQSRTRGRRRPHFPLPAHIGLPDVEPELVRALSRLSEQQRVCVVLIECYQWTYQEVADLLGLSRGAVQSHAGRGMEHLRRAIGVATDV